MATALLYDYLVSRGARVVAYIPDRIDEGYGMNCEAVDKLALQGVGLIVTVDNGISCAKEIDYANSLGISTVVTDHHIPPETLPNAIAVVDPHRTDCPSSFKEIYILKKFLFFTHSFILLNMLLLVFSFLRGFKSLRSFESFLTHNSQFLIPNTSFRRAREEPGCPCPPRHG